MDSISNLCGLLEEKKNLFLDYEQATLALLDCAPDDVEKYITLREHKATEIDGVEEQLMRQCARQPGGRLLDYAHAKLPFEQVPSEYQRVFYGGQAVNSVIYRISRSEKQVMQRLYGLREGALNAVKQNQNLPKIKKYLTDLTDQPGAGSLRNEKI